MRTGCVVLLGVASLLAGCRKESAATAVNCLGEVPPDIRAGRSQEARAWLAAGTRNNVGEYPPEEARRHVEDLYARGARKVLALDIRDDGDHENAQFLIAELPKEPGLRSRLFDVSAALARRSGEFEPAADTGGDCLPYWYEASGPRAP